MIYVIANEKGGAGKSSLAQNLAVYLAIENKVDTLLIDADPQRTTAEWAHERNESGLPQIPCVEMSGNLAKDLVNLEKRYDALVIDCGGADSEEMISALAVGDVAIIPFRPKRRDLRRAKAMAERLKMIKANNGGLIVVSVITQAPTLPSQGKRIMAAKELLNELELNPLDNITRNLNSWDDSEEAGCSVLEYSEDDKAGKDARKVFGEIVWRDEK